MSFNLEKRRNLWALFDYILHNYYLCVLGRVPISEKKEIVSNYNGDGSEKDAKIQIEFAFCQTLFKLIASFKPTPGDFCWSWIPKGSIQKQKENLSCLYILHKILHKEFPSHSGPVDIKEMHHTAWCTCRAVLLLIKPRIFDLIIAVIIVVSQAP